MEKLCTHWPLGCAVPGRLLQNDQNHEIRTNQLFQAAQSVKISGSKAFNLTSHGEKYLKLRTRKGKIKKKKKKRGVGVKHRNKNTKNSFKIASLTI